MPAESGERVRTADKRAEGEGEGREDERVASEIVFHSREKKRAIGTE